MTTIKCKVSQPNVKLSGEFVQVGSIVAVSSDTAALFPLSLIPEDEVKQVEEKKTPKQKAYK